MGNKTRDGAQEERGRCENQKGFRESYLEHLKKYRILLAQVTYLESPAWDNTLLTVGFNLRYRGSHTIKSYRDGTSRLYAPSARGKTPGGIPPPPFKRGL